MRLRADNYIFLLGLYVADDDTVHQEKHHRRKHWLGEENELSVRYVKVKANVSPPCGDEKG